MCVYLLGIYMYIIYKMKEMLYCSASGYVVGQTNPTMECKANCFDAIWYGGWV